MGKGEKAICNWDEDTLTMAVEAASNCLAAGFSGKVDTISLASTTAVFTDRSNATVIAEALELGEAIVAAEFSGSRRAGTTALILSVGSAAIGAETLVVASDRRSAKPGSPQELAYGHGAAAITIGAGEKVIARCVAHHSIARDLVDQFRQSGVEEDYGLEERWVRDEGWLKIVPSAIEAVLAKAQVRSSQIQHTIIPSPSRNIAEAVARSCGLPGDSVVDALNLVVGDTGAAHPLLMLALCLERAKVGDIILLTSFGQGCDAILLQVTNSILNYRQKRGPIGLHKNRRLEENYVKYLSFAGQLSAHSGMRAEHDKRTAHTVAYRKHEMISGLNGGKCSACGTVQFPRTRGCVNPQCRQFNTQEPYSLRGSPAAIKTFTEDWLAFSPCPPLFYGNIQFTNGANIMMELTDVDPGQIAVGMPVRLLFRIKDTDDRRGFRRYFWKAAPIAAAET